MNFKIFNILRRIKVIISSLLNIFIYIEEMVFK